MRIHYSEVQFSKVQFSEVQFSEVQLIMQPFSYIMSSSRISSSDM